MLRIASDHRVPVVPRGGGSGTQGGTFALHGGISIDLTQMDRVIEVDETSLVVTAEAGVTGPQLEQALSPLGLAVAHEPGLSISEPPWVAGWRPRVRGQVHEIRQGRRSGPPSRGRPPSRAAGLDAPGPEPCRRTGPPAPPRRLGRHDGCSYLRHASHGPDPGDAGLSHLRVRDGFRRARSRTSDHDPTLAPGGHAPVRRSRGTSSTTSWGFNSPVHCSSSSATGTGAWSISRLRRSPRYALRLAGRLSGPKGREPGGMASTSRTPRERRRHLRRSSARPTPSAPSTTCPTSTGRSERTSRKASPNTAPRTRRICRTGSLGE